MSICVIPARGGSRRIPRKNIRDFHGKPIIAYSIELALPLFDKVIVSTDDEAIAQIASFNGATPMSRPADLCVDDVGTQQVMAHVLHSIGAKQSDVACCLYPCAPLVEDADLRCALQLHYLRPSRFVVSVAADPLRDIGNFYIGAAQDFMNGAPLYGIWTGLYVMPPERSIDINTEDDWQQAERMYAALHL